MVSELRCRTAFLLDDEKDRKTPTITKKEEIMAKCEAKCEVYSRVCGYFRPVSNWNKGKKEEFAERKTFNLKGAKA